MAQRVEIRLSGAGGDGLLTAGKILGAAAVIYDEKHATQSQSYGPEARGGACRSEVIISDEDIEYPKVSALDVLLALTQEAVERYHSDVREGGLLIVDSENVPHPPAGPYTVFRLPLRVKAREELGSVAVASIVALGAILALRPVVTRQGLENAVLLHVPKGTEELHKRALDLGYHLAEVAQVQLAEAARDKAQT